MVQYYCERKMTKDIMVISTYTYATFQPFTVSWPLENIIIVRPNAKSYG
jgi:hypothetical protein